jgi:hypothetical protein
LKLDELLLAAKQEVHEHEGEAAGGGLASAVLESQPVKRSREQLRVATASESEWRERLWYAEERGSCSRKRPL